MCALSEAAGIEKSSARDASIGAGASASILGCTCCEGQGHFEKSTWQGEYQFYSDLEEDKTPEEDPRDEVGDKIYFTKQEILADLQVNSPRGRPLKLFKDHLAN